MRKGLWFCLFTVVLMSVGLDARAALAADDDDLEAGETRALVSNVLLFEPPTPIFLVTFMKSRTTDPIRTATVVSVTNHTDMTCDVSVVWFRGSNPTSVCTTTRSLDAGFQVDFCSRAIPDALTSCNATCAPDLTFAEGKAVVSIPPLAPWLLAKCANLGVSARVYYTTGATDSAVTAISDSQIVQINQEVPAP